MRKISIVIPAKDEEASIDLLFAEIQKATVHYEWEVVFVDDGSKDSTWRRMVELSHSHPGRVKALRLRRNFGKAAALSTGFQSVSTDAEIVLTMDADLQDDPSEIPRFVNLLHSQGLDVVSGWKQDRQDPWSKTIPSRVFNRITALASGVRLRDFNCGFKAYRREVLQSMHLYGELHRYIPVLAADLGYKVGEIAVNHRPRTHGHSKYGIERYARGMVDLITVLATTRYLQKPGHLFGGLGLLFALVGFVTLLYLGVLWMLDMGPIGTRPLFFVGILMEILAVQLLSLGVLSELVTRGAEARPISAMVEEVSGFDAQEQRELRG